MGPGRKLPDQVIIPCFSCHRVMLPVGPLGGWCDTCQVSEYQGNLPSRVRTVSCQFWGDMRIDYIDHSREHVPSPA
jgi:hypothetical protein